MPGFNDNMRTSKKIASMFDDSRVQHFFDPMPSHRAGKALAKGIVTPGAGPAWDMYFFYAKKLAWQDELPKPTRYFHQLSGGKRADPNLFFTGQQLIEKLHEAMHEMVSDSCSGR